MPDSGLMLLASLVLFPCFDTYYKWSLAARTLILTLILFGQPVAQRCLALQVQNPYVCDDDNERLDACVDEFVSQHLAVHNQCPAGHETDSFQQGRYGTKADGTGGLTHERQPGTFAARLDMFC